MFLIENEIPSYVNVYLLTPLYVHMRKVVTFICIIRKLRHKKIACLQALFFKEKAQIFFKCIF